jgi:hypothetical protein
MQHLLVHILSASGTWRRESECCESSMVVGFAEARFGCKLYVGVAFVAWREESSAWVVRGLKTGMLRCVVLIFGKFSLSSYTE